MPILQKYRVLAVLCLFALTAPMALVAAPATLAAHRVFRVTLNVPSDQPRSGRLLLFAIPADKARTHDGKVEKVDTSAFFPTQTAVAAMDVEGLAPGKSVLVDADALAFPRPFSELAPGKGKVNSEVVKYWRDHYDIAHRIKTKWPEANIPAEYSHEIRH